MPNGVEHKVSKHHNGKRRKKYYPKENIVYYPEKYEQQEGKRAYTAKSHSLYRAHIEGAGFFVFARLGVGLPFVIRAEKIVHGNAEYLAHLL